MRLLIIVPCYESIEPATFKSIYGLQRVDGWDYLLDVIEGYGVQHARTLAVTEAIEGGFDKLLFVDSDVILPPDAIPRLLAVDAAIATGWHMKKRSLDGATELYDYDAENMRFVNIDTSELNGEVRDVGGCGMGCCMIDIPAITPVYDNSWLEYVVYLDGSRLSEDNNFCLHAAKAGLSIKADTSLRCGHVCKIVL